MEKLFLSLAGILVLFSCQNEENNLTNPENAVKGRRGCATQEVLTQQLKADPCLNQIEAFSERAMLDQG